MIVLEMASLEFNGKGRQDTPLTKRSGSSSVDFSKESISLSDPVRSLRKS